MSRLGKDGLTLAGIFLASGVMHVVRPEPFVAMVPRALPFRRALVHISGAAELACAAGLLVPPTRRAAGLTSAVLLVGVFPGNLTMTARARQRMRRDPGDAALRGYFVATVARLPLQWPLIRTALRAAGVLR